MEKPFDVLDGVIATTSGYTGGYQAFPTYHEVGAGVRQQQKREREKSFIQLIMTLVKTLVICFIFFSSPF